MLRLFNTLTRKKEAFKPLKKKTVTLYSCGLTVYNFAHLGNLRSYVFNDVLKRVLRFNGFSVKHVMNITDVGHLTSDADEGEDKMEVGAKREGRDAWKIAEFYTEKFLQDLDRLNIISADTMPRATGTIPLQIDLITKLEKKGYTYQTSDGVYFDTSKFPTYGQLARLNLAGQQEGARVKRNAEKRNPTDFVLWKFSPAGSQRQMEWPSPWGKGFPGWHIECSAMAMHYLGKTIDIHTGGIDHIPVHHTNEIAQSEAATGKKFVNYWLHGDFLTVKKDYHCPYCKYNNLTPGPLRVVNSEIICKKCAKLFDPEKMSKSKGDILTLQTVIDKGFDPLAYRYFVLQAHYRSKLTFSWTALQAAQTAYLKLKEQSQSFGKAGRADKEWVEKFSATVNDDLNTPKALAVTWQMLKSALPSRIKKATLLRFDTVLGLGLDQPISQPLHIPSEIQKIARDREAARKRKDWATADQLRAVSAQKGYLIEDTPSGTEVKPAP